ncbi:helix-turn-helix domain-containing protein [Vagococcus fluvialis]|uniref:helix-turn-helix domain-containing protein n=1 Tax=Vagococcus fluvialis TaxID=2738 RepID=UPI003B216F3B
MSGLNSEVIKKIKKLRIEQGLSQERLSELAGLDPKYINKLENGRFNLTVPTLERILIALEINVGFFFSDFIESEISILNDLLQYLDGYSPKKKEEVVKKLLMFLREIKE